MEFFELLPFLRLIFSFAFMSTAAGLLVKIWEQHSINYIHIMQVDYVNRMNPYQLWSLSGMLWLLFLTAYYVSMTQIATVYQD